MEESTSLLSFDGATRALDSSRVLGSSPRQSIGSDPLDLLLSEEAITQASASSESTVVAGVQLHADNDDSESDTSESTKSSEASRLRATPSQALVGDERALSHSHQPLTLVGEGQAPSRSYQPSRSSLSGTRPKESAAEHRYRQLNKYSEDKVQDVAWIALREALPKLAVGNARLCSETCISEKLHLMEQVAQAKQRQSDLEDTVRTLRERTDSMAASLYQLNAVTDRFDALTQENAKCKEQLQRANHNNDKLEKTISDLLNEVAVLRVGGVHSESRGEMALSHSPNDVGERASSPSHIADEMWAPSHTLAGRPECERAPNHSQDAHSWKDQVVSEAQPAIATVLSQITDVLRQLSDRQRQVEAAIVSTPASGRMDSGGPKHRIPAPKFKGYGEDIEMFFEMFRRYCTLTNVSEATRTDVLLTCLHDNVYAALHKAGVTTRPSWENVIKALRTTYGTVKKPKTWRAEFQAARRQKGETLMALSQRLQYLAKQSRVDFPADVMIERFLAAVDKAPWASWLQTVTDTFSVTSFDGVVALAIDMENKFNLDGRKAFTVAGGKEDTGGTTESEWNCNVVAPSRSSSETTVPAMIPTRAPSPAPVQETVNAVNVNTTMDSTINTLVAQQQQLMTYMTKMLEACQQGVAAAKTETALSQRSERSSHPRQRKNSPRRGEQLGCHGCGSLDHQVRQCKYPCARCKGFGHTAVVCRRPLNQDQKNESRDAHAPQ